jgi:hypothetical protein
VCTAAEEGKTYWPKKETVGLRRWGAALPVLWLVEMRLFCGAACGRLKERELGLSTVSRSCRCWRSVREIREFERGEVW